MKESLKRIKKFRLRERGRCPKKGKLAAFFLSETSREEKFKLIDHITACSRCRTEFVILKEIWEKGHSLFTPEIEEILEKANPFQMTSLAQKELKFLAQKRESRKLGNISLLKAGLLATASIAAMLIIYFAALDRHHPAALERDLEPDTFQILEPWSAVDAGPILFRWSPVSEAKNYTLEILDGSLEVIYRKEDITSTSFELADDFRVHFSKSKTYFWKVIANLDDGKSVESEFGKFRITGN